MEFIRTAKGKTAGDLMYAACNSHTLTDTSGTKPCLEGVFLSSGSTSSESSPCKEVILCDGDV